MKILYNIAGTYRSGGMERVLSNKANWLARHGHKVYIATTDQLGRPSFFKFDESITCVDLDINYEYNNGKGLINKIYNFPFKQIKHLHRLQKLVRELHPDIIISMLCNDVGLIPKLNFDGAKVAEAHFCHDKFLLYDRKGIWKYIDKYRTRLIENQVKQYDAFVVLTHQDKPDWNMSSKIHIIPNACTYKDTIASPLNKKRVIALGRYEYQKGLDRLLLAWKLINEKFADWELSLIGEGQERPQLERLIKSLGLQNVHLEKPTSDVPKEFLNSSLLVLPSRYEGFGMVLVEAQSYGIPIIAFNCKCGPNDIITNNVDGILVEEGDIKELAESIMQLMKDEKRKKEMGHAAYINAGRFSEENIMAKWESLFHQLVIEQE